MFARLPKQGSGFTVQLALAVHFLEGNGASPWHVLCGGVLICSSIYVAVHSLISVRVWGVRSEECEATGSPQEALWVIYKTRLWQKFHLVRHFLVVLVAAVFLFFFFYLFFFLLVFAASVFFFPFSSLLLSFFLDDGVIFCVINPLLLPLIILSLHLPSLCIC